MGLLGDIKKSISRGRYNISSHARREMSPVEDDISEGELMEAILGGEVIEDYLGDKPFPSCLIFGESKSERPLHVVCAYSGEDDFVVVITAYEPDPGRWVEYRRRV